MEEFTHTKQQTECHSLFRWNNFTCNEQHRRGCVDLDTVLLNGFFFSTSPLDIPMLVFLRWEYVGVHPDSLLAFFFLWNVDLGSKPTSLEMTDSIYATLPDNGRVIH